MLVSLMWSCVINPLMSSVTFLYSQKTSENLRFSDVFRGCKKVTLDVNGLTVITCLFWAIFGTNHLCGFWKFWNCPCFTPAISTKLSKIHLGNLSQIVCVSWGKKLSFLEGQSRSEDLTAFWHKLGRGKKNYLWLLL